MQKTRWNLLLNGLVRPHTHWRMMQLASLQAGTARSGDEARICQLEAKLSSQLERDIGIYASREQYGGNGGLLVPMAAALARRAMNGHLETTKNGTSTWVKPVGWVSDPWFQGVLKKAIRASKSELRHGEMDDLQSPEPNDDEPNDGVAVAQTVRHWTNAMLLLADHRTAILGLLETRLPSYSRFQDNREAILQRIPPELLSAEGELASFGQAGKQILFGGAGSEATISSGKKSCDELRKEVDRLFRGGRALPQEFQPWRQRLLAAAASQGSADPGSLLRDFVRDVTTMQIPKGFPAIDTALKKLRDVDRPDLLATAVADFSRLLRLQEPTDELPMNLLAWLQLVVTRRSRRQNHPKELSVEESLRLILSLPAVDTLRNLAAAQDATDRYDAELTEQVDFRRELLEFMNESLPLSGPERTLWNGLTRGARNQAMLLKLASELGSPSDVDKPAWQRVRQQLLVWRTAIEFDGLTSDPYRWLIEYPDGSLPWQSARRLSTEQATEQVSAMYLAVRGVLRDQLPQWLQDANLIGLADEAVVRLENVPDAPGFADTWSHLCNGSTQDNDACQLILRSILAVVQQNVWFRHVSYSGWKLPFFAAHLSYR